MKKFFHTRLLLFVSSFIFVFPFSSLAEEANKSIAAFNSVVTDGFTRVRKQFIDNAKLYAKDPQTAYVFLDQEFQRWFDFSYFSRLVAGKYRRQMNEQQLSELEKTIKNGLFKIYIANLLKEETIKQLDDYTLMFAGATKIEQSKVLSYDVTYKIRGKKGKEYVIICSAREITPGVLKATNVTIENINIALTYRQQFEDIVNKSGGINQALAEWEKTPQKAETKPE